MSMKIYNSGALREDKTGKGRCDLLPASALLRLSKHCEIGAINHGERNWEKGLPMHSFIDSAIRHLLKYLDGQRDEDHLCAAAWNCLAAMWTEEHKPEMQDIATRMDNGQFLQSVYQWKGDKPPYPMHTVEELRTDAVGVQPGEVDPSSGEGDGRQGDKPERERVHGEGNPGCDSMRTREDGGHRTEEGEWG